MAGEREMPSPQWTRMRPSCARAWSMYALALQTHVGADTLGKAEDQLWEDADQVLILGVANFEDLVVEVFGEAGFDEVAAKMLRCSPGQGSIELASLSRPVCTERGSSRVTACKPGCCSIGTVRQRGPSRFLALA
jgi:hypothetical protein